MMALVKLAKPVRHEIDMGRMMRISMLRKPFRHEDEKTSQASMTKHVEESWCRDWKTDKTSYTNTRLTSYAKKFI